MLIRLFAAFIIIPFVELYLLLRLAGVTGPGATFLLVVVTGVIGSLLARREGLIALHRFQSALAEGRMPSREIQDGLMIVFAGALLLTPGLITDTVGFALLIPAGREFVRRFVIRRYAARFNVHVLTPGNVQSDIYHPDDRDDGYTIEAKAVRK